MTLRELINSVDSEQYSDNALYQKLREIKPEYGSNRHIQVKLIDGKVVVTNAHSTYFICLPFINSRWPLVLMREVSPFRDAM